MGSSWLMAGISFFFEEMPINIEYMDSTIPNDGDFQIYF